MRAGGDGQSARFRIWQSRRNLARKASTSHVQALAPFPACQQTPNRAAWLSAPYSAMRANLDSRQAFAYYLAGEAVLARALAAEHADMCAWVPLHSAVCDHWSRHVNS